MKKFVTILLTLSLAACMVVTAAACGNNDNPPAPDDNKSEYDFIDYAEKVYLNTEKYPELEDQGLFVLGYDEGKGVFDVRASSAEGAAMVDPKNRPSFWFTAGSARTLMKISATLRKR